MRVLTMAVVAAAMASSATADDWLGFDAAGSAALRVPSAPRLPFEFRGRTDNPALGVMELDELTGRMRRETEQIAIVASVLDGLSERILAIVEEASE